MHGRRGRTPKRGGSIFPNKIAVLRGTLCSMLPVAAVGGAVVVGGCEAFGDLQPGRQKVVDGLEAAMLEPSTFLDCVRSSGPREVVGALLARVESCWPLTRGLTVLDNMER
eukprot:4753144-Pyramimonas_sp.AAC.1